MKTVSIFHNKKLLDSIVVDFVPTIGFSFYTAQITDKKEYLFYGDGKEMEGWYLIVEKIFYNFETDSFDVFVNHTC